MTPQIRKDIPMMNRNMTPGEVAEHAADLEASAEQVRAAALVLGLSSYSRHADESMAPETYCIWTAVLAACEHDKDRAGQVMAKIAGTLLLLGMAPRTTTITPQGEAGELVAVWEAFAEPSLRQITLTMNHTATMLEEYAAGIRRALDKAARYMI